MLLGFPESMSTGFQEGKLKEKERNDSPHKSWAWKSQNVTSTTFYWSQSQGQPKFRGRRNKLPILLGEQHVYRVSARVDAGRPWSICYTAEHIFYSSVPGEIYASFH